MVWAPGGFLRNLGALDFAGGTVVHMNAGLAGIAAALMLGRRKHLKDRGEAPPPHNLMLTLLGAGILWFGWYGFNAGSALSAGATAANAFTTTTLATCAAMLGWLAADTVRGKGATSSGAAAGAVAGLVAITPACGFVGPGGAVAIGLIAGFGCAYAVKLKDRIRLDDALDTGGVHFVGGLLGALLIGVFAAKGFNSAGADGLLSGGGLAQMGKQLAAVAFTIGFSFLGSLAVLWVTKKLTRGLRVSEKHEEIGLAEAQHGEPHYHLPWAAAPSKGHSSRPLTGVGADN
jgi:Amt family ammonium transporter